MEGQPYDRSQCPVERTLTLLAGKWRLMILFRLGPGPQRFNALQRSLTPVSPRVLTQELRDLERDGLVWRRSEGSVPPEVHYGLTDAGRALAPVFDALAAWDLTMKKAAPLRTRPKTQPLAGDQFLA
jgi:DNA-binding HxlR family transcriptional regulator